MTQKARNPEKKAGGVVNAAGGPSWCTVGSGQRGERKADTLAAFHNREHKFQGIEQFDIDRFDFFVYLTF